MSRSSPAGRLLAAAAVLALTGCDQPSPRHPRLAPRPTPLSTAPIARRPPSVAWSSADRAFVLYGKTLRAERSWTFDGSTGGFQATGAGVAPAQGSGLSVQLSGPDAALRSPRGLKVRGGARPLILVRVTRLRAGGAWDGTIYYTTAAHGESEKFLARPVVGWDPAVNETVTLVYDMSRLRAGGRDWIKSRIEQIRLDLDDQPGGAFVIRQLVIAANPDQVVFRPMGPVSPD